MSPSSAPAPRASAPRNALKNSGLSVIVLEARDRVGGRAHTIMASPDVTFDVGCGWLHSADENSFVKIAEQLEFRNQPDRCRPGASAPTARRFRRTTATSSSRALDAFYDRAEQAAQEAERAAATAPPIFVSSPATAGTR